MCSQIVSFTHQPVLHGTCPFPYGKAGGSDTAVKYYYILGDVEFTNTMNRMPFNFDPLLMIEAYELNVQERQRVEREEWRRERVIREEKERVEREVAEQRRREREEYEEQQRQIKLKHERQQNQIWYHIKLLAVSWLIVSAVCCICSDGTYIKRLFVFAWHALLIAALWCAFQLRDRYNAETNLYDQCIATGVYLYIELACWLGWTWHFLLLWYVLILLISILFIALVWFITKYHRW